MSGGSDTLGSVNTMATVVMPFRLSVRQGAAAEIWLYPMRKAQRRMTDNRVAPPRGGSVLVPRKAAGARCTEYAEATSDVAMRQNDLGRSDGHSVNRP